MCISISIFLEVIQSFRNSSTLGVDEWRLWMTYNDVQSNQRRRMTRAQAVAAAFDHRLEEKVHGCLRRELRRCWVVGQVGLAVCDAKSWNSKERGSTSAGCTKAHRGWEALTPRYLMALQMTGVKDPNPTAIWMAKVQHSSKPYITSEVHLVEANLAPPSLDHEFHNPLVLMVLLVMARHQTWDLELSYRQCHNFLMMLTDT